MTHGDRSTYTPTSHSRCGPVRRIDARLLEERTELANSGGVHGGGMIFIFDDFCNPSIPVHIPEIGVLLKFWG